MRGEEMRKLTMDRDMFGVESGFYDQNGHEHVISAFPVLSTILGPSFVGGATRTCSFDGFFSNTYNISFADPKTDSNLWIPSNSEITHCLHETSFGSKQNSKRFGCRYVHVVQEILAEIASYSLESVPTMSCYSSSSPGDGGVLVSSEVDGRFEKRAAEAKKTELLTLLQVVDDQYKQCVEEIDTVISAFHAVTELDPQRHKSFAVRTISCLYKNLRERISSQMMAFPPSRAFGAELGAKGVSSGGKEWALRQQKRKELPLWRPERGLPEKSVAVLRAWMFQNFLHPYPKDADKHLLAVKSGLSRNQVSNWFINARVRLWKPMIEEMYSEMSMRKARDMREDGSNKVSRKSDKSKVRYELNRN